MPDFPRIILHNETTNVFEATLQDAWPQAEIATSNSYASLTEMVPRFRPDIVYSVRFAGSTGFPSNVLTGPHGPKWISIGGSGIDHLGAWDTTRTTVTNSAGVAAAMMAEYAFGVYLHFTLNIAGLNQDKSAKIWRARSVRPLARKTLLIVGMGQTGQAMAARAQAFGMNVIGVRARPKKTPNVDAVHPPTDLLHLLPQADFILVCTPLLPSTRGMIGKSEVSAMKQGAILVDVSRGGVVDQSALYNALQSRAIAGAGIDVFETEPLPCESPLWALENVILSPHCSSVYDGWEMASFEMFLRNFSRWMTAAPLHNIVNPALGY